MDQSSARGAIDMSRTGSSFSSRCRASTSSSLSAASCSTLRGVCGRRHHAHEDVILDHFGHDAVDRPARCGGQKAHHFAGSLLRRRATRSSVSICPRRRRTRLSSFSACLRERARSLPQIYRRGQIEDTDGARIGKPRSGCREIGNFRPTLLFRVKPKVERRCDLGDAYHRRTEQVAELAATSAAAWVHTITPSALGAGTHTTLSSTAWSYRAVSRLSRLAGAEGIEPSNAGIKIRCLTAWRRPSGRAVRRNMARRRTIGRDPCPFNAWICARFRAETAYCGSESRSI